MGPTHADIQKQDSHSSYYYYDAGKDTHKYLTAFVQKTMHKMQSIETHDKRMR